MKKQTKKYLWWAVYAGAAYYAYTYLQSRSVQQPIVSVPAGTVQQ